MANTTKRDIALTLGECLRERRLDEITVKDLTERCGISRQAFYYHFSDLYGVVKWAVNWELERIGAAAEKAREEGQTKSDWEYIVGLLEERMLPNRTIVLNVYRAIERSYVQYHLMSSARAFLAAEVERAAAGRRVSEAQRQLVTEILTTGLVNVYLGWMDMGMPSRHMEQLDDFKVVMDGCVEHILLRLAENNEN